jgi:DNA invertase Pin-like site-specific DNA recombinase
LILKSHEKTGLYPHFDTRTPEGKLLYTVSAALAEWERAILRQRIREGMAAAKSVASKSWNQKILSGQKPTSTKRHIPLLRIYRRNLKSALPH